MGNMSYCRFENTSGDLVDCVNALNTMVDNHGKEDEAQEDGEEQYSDLSDSEKRALLDLAYQAETYLDSVKELLELNEVSHNLETGD